jgi:hypothetical protein
MRTDCMSFLSADKNDLVSLGGVSTTRAVL